MLYVCLIDKLNLKNIPLNRNGISGVDNETISVEEIVSYFKECNGQLGKPKLFFIQACRNDSEIKDDSAGIDYKNSLCPPDSSDILVAYSTIEGELSYRHIYEGSWFIQTLLKQINMHAHNAHLMDIMIVVNKDMAESDLKGERQMPQQVSTLTKFVYFQMANVLEANNEDGRSGRTVERTTPRRLSGSNNMGESDHTGTRSRSGVIFGSSNSSESDRGAKSKSGIFDSNNSSESDHTGTRSRSGVIFASSSSSESDRSTRSRSRIFGSNNNGESEQTTSRSRSTPTSSVHIYSESNCLVL